jgi:hypothetical protein
MAPPEPCKFMHKTLLAGVCPWCGSVVLNGQAVSPESPLLGLKYQAWSLARKKLAKLCGMLPVEPEPEPRDVLATDYLLAIIEDCGRDSLKAIPLLRVALKDRDWSVRLAAANALARIGPSAKEAIPALHLLLQDKDQLVRDAAEEAIKSIDK